MRKFSFSIVVLASTLMGMILGMIFGMEAVKFFLHLTIAWLLESLFKFCMPDDSSN